MLPCGSQPTSVGRQNSYFCAVRFGGCGATGNTPLTARGLLPSTISTLPSGLNLVTMFEPSSTVQMLSSLSTRTEWANSKPRNPLPISLRNLPVGSNSKSRLLLLRWKMKMWPLEFVATATASPRYSPGGSFRKFGTVVNEISGTPWIVALRCANAGASANTEKAASEIKYRFMDSQTSKRYCMRSARQVVGSISTPIRPKPEPGSQPLQPCGAGHCVRGAAFRGASRLERRLAGTKPYFSPVPRRVSKC